jgi:phosphatidylserine/phosphatidylglycerophosphate/cardiolipin synthase-like enzyme
MISSVPRSFSTYSSYLVMRRLLAAGGGVRARRGRGRTLHCKYFVADGVRVGFGSHNLLRLFDRVFRDFE